MSQVYAALGIALWISDGGSPDGFFKVNKCGDFSGPKVKVDTIDVTTHDTLDGYKDFISSLKDGQEVTFPIMLDPSDITHNETATVVGTNAGGLKYLLEARAKRPMKLVLPTSPTARFSFSGLVTGFDLDGKVTGALMSSVTIKVSKKPTLEIGT